ncbi:hypothetical protein G9464_07125 [Halostella sp. JP-L12]|uniref:DUF7344 domain-containing protein n=1 Tax=Halostella TaxID=1843185 RepID=UPI000EF84910|nr:MULTISPECIES: hypothetical protein [Halostella]NHN47366.1 hypothetical protein [Halostella sp. JP-L12]
MQSKLLQEPESDGNSIINAVTHGRRRRTLELLRECGGALDAEGLATHLAAVENEKRLFEVTEDEFRETLVALRHNHLPALADANLIERDEESGAVAVSDHPVHDDPKLDQIVSVEADDWDAVLESLAEGRRRVALTVLSAADGPVDRDRLARAVVAREQGVDEIEVPPRDAEDVLVTLHHVHLPMLDDAGLVEYDRDADEVAYAGHPDLDEEWLLFETGETPRPILADAERSDDVWTVHGTEDVVARAHTLFDRADDELFIMATTTGLIQEGCIRRLQAALDRGVDVYVGSQTPEVRDLVRERLPEAVIWEPQMDWLNMAPSERRVGRLVFADREAIMLGTLGDEIETGVYEETALTGAGTDNGVVMLVRELLGSRLDHLDAQSEDFRSQLPL